MLERLEPRLLLDAGPLVISEFLAVNDSIFPDEDGDYSDWIEIHNPTDTEVNLDGWYLTDDDSDLTRWEFPAVAIGPNEYRVVFASNKDRDVGELHTNFQLDGDGEYLALVRPDGTTISHDYSPEFPEQFSDQSFGLTRDVTTLLPDNGSGDRARLTYHVPELGDSGLGTSWTELDFDNTGWAGSVGPPPVVITETDTHGVDFVEIQNVSEDPVNVDGWFVVVNDASDDRDAVPPVPPDINAFHEVVWWLSNEIQPGVMEPGEVRYRHDRLDSSADSWGANIFWRDDSPGWAMLVDDGGRVVDFVVWGYSNQEIDSLEINVETFDLTAEGAWIGDSLPQDPDPPDPRIKNSRQRDVDSDSDAASDWITAPDSMNVQNPGLDLPFPGGPMTGIGFTADPSDLGGIIRTDVEAAMLGVNSSIWTRIPFSVDEDLSLVDSIHLWMKYDDAFVAYLNGQEIARSNAPASPAWNEAADSPRDDAGMTQYEDIDVTAQIGLLQQGPNVLAIHGLNDHVDNGEFLILPKIVVTEREVFDRYMAIPSPGEMNDAGITEAAAYSHETGIFIDPFSLTLAVASSAATIYYTTDGSVPTEASPVYTGPISIDTTTRIRARVHEPDREWGPVVSHGYIFLDQNALDFDSDVPIIIVETYGQRLGDTRLTPATAVFIEPGNDGRARITAQHEFAGRAGIRRRGQSSQGWPKGQYAFETWEETFDSHDDTQPIRSEDAPDLAVSLFGLPAESDWIIQGPYSDKSLMRNYLSYSWSNDIGLYAPRVQFCEVFLNTQGGKIEYPGRILTSNPGSGNYEDGYVGTYVFMEKIKRDGDRVDIAALTPEDNSFPEITGGYIYKKDKPGAGDREWNTILAYQELRHVEPKADEITPQQDAYLKQYINDMEAAIFGPNFTDPDTGYAAYLDPPSFIDNWILVEMTKNIDGFRLSTYYNKDRDGKVKMGPIWDYNLSLGNANYADGGRSSGWYNAQISHDVIDPVLGIRPTNSQYPYWDRLFEDPNFSQLLVDRWQELRREEFTTAELMAGVDEAATIIDEAQARNFNKWRVLDEYLWPNTHYNSTWQQEIDWMKNWLATRVDWIDSQFLAGVEFAPQDGGIVEPGFEVTLSGPVGTTIYYTLDGSDPRLRGGAVNTGSARIYTGFPITITEDTPIKTRALGTNAWSDWSGLNSAEFFVGVAAAVGNLAITEINYNPHDPTAAEQAIDPNVDLGNDDFEFIEFYNYSPDHVILSGMRFTDGITFDFTTADVRTLWPGEYAVIARDVDAFPIRYGTQIELAGDYSKNFNNDGEQVTLVDRSGEVLFDFTYRDRDDWPGRADGKGATLELIDPEAVPQDPVERLDYLEDGDNWRSSVKYGGTPGREADPPVGIVINEVLSRTVDPIKDAIELHNTTAMAVDIGGWFLSDTWGWETEPGKGNYQKYRIDDNTIIPAGGYRVFDEWDFNLSRLDADPLNDDPGDFALNGAHGDDVWLMKVDAQGHLTHFADHVDFGPAAIGESFGRWPNGAGDLYPMIAPTLDKLRPGDGLNSLPRIGPVIISEVHYNPWLIGDDSGLEFIEIVNPTGEAVDLLRWGIGGIGYQFPDAAVLGPREVLVLLPFPLSDAQMWSAFASEYNLDPAQTDGFLGPYTDLLHDDGERVQLQRPSAEPLDEPGYFPPVAEDEVRYDDEPPWPEQPDGHGPSLHRLAIDAPGNMDTSWEAGTPTPGQTDLLSERPRVVDRHVFYNNSFFDGNDPVAGPEDDDAIAPDKQALLPGQTATLANYTSYTGGLNGIMVDVADLVDGLPEGVTPGVNDFRFRMGNNNTPDGWATAPDPSTITMRPGEGTGGSDRITLIWDDGPIAKQWLQVTVLVTATTRLAAEDVFYFGNAIGETGNSTTDAKVNAIDMLGARDNQRHFLDPAPIDFAFDFDRNQRVNASDMLIARNNTTHFLNALQLITVPPAAGDAVPPAAGDAVPPAAGDAVRESRPVTSVEMKILPGKLAWLHEYDLKSSPERLQRPATAGRTPGLLGLAAAMEW